MINRDHEVVAEPSETRIGPNVHLMVLGNALIRLGYGEEFSGGYMVFDAEMARMLSEHLARAADHSDTMLAELEAMANAMSDDEGRTDEETLTEVN